MVEIYESDLGDWVRVKLNGKIIIDQHSLRTIDLVRILNKLEIDVIREERPEEFFYNYD